MSIKKLLYVIIPIVIVILGFIFIPPYFENRINPKFDQGKMDEVKMRNEALYQEMIANFDKSEEAIRKNPSDSGAWLNIGVISDTFGDEELAEKAYKKVIELEPTSFFARSNLAALYLRQGRYAETESEYKTILANNKADIQTNESLARLYASEKIGTKADAKRVLEEAIALTDDATLKELLAKLERGEA